MSKLSASPSSEPDSTARQLGRMPRPSYPGPRRPNHRSDTGCSRREDVHGDTNRRTPPRPSPLTKPIGTWNVASRREKRNGSPLASKPTNNPPASPLAHRPGVSARLPERVDRGQRCVCVLCRLRRAQPASLWRSWKGSRRSRGGASRRRWLRSRSFRLRPRDLRSRAAEHPRDLPAQNIVMRRDPHGERPSRAASHHWHRKDFLGADKRAEDRKRDEANRNWSAIRAPKARCGISAGDLSGSNHSADQARRSARSEGVEPPTF